MCSTHWPRHVDLSRDDAKRVLRRLELEAYASVVTALRARGDLTKEKKQILQDLQQTLSISTERHRAEVRRAVNDEKLSTIAQHMNTHNSNAEWLIEGRRLVPLMPRLVPQTAFTPTANSAAENQAARNLNLPPPAHTGKDIYAPPPPLPAAVPSTLTPSQTPSLTPTLTRPASPKNNVVVLPSGMSIHIKGGLTTEDEDNTQPITQPHTSLTQSQSLRGKLRTRRRSSSADSLIITKATLGGVAPPSVCMANMPAKLPTPNVPSVAPTGMRHGMEKGMDSIMASRGEGAYTGGAVSASQTQFTPTAPPMMRSPGPIPKHVQYTPAASHLVQNTPTPTPTASHSSASHSASQMIKQQQSHQHQQQQQKVVMVANMGQTPATASPAVVTQSNLPTILQRPSSLSGGTHARTITPGVPMATHAPTPSPTTPSSASGAVGMKLLDHIVSMTTGGPTVVKQQTISSISSPGLSGGPPVRTLQRTRTIITRPRAPLNQGQTQHQRIVIPSGSSHHHAPVQIRHEGSMKIITQSGGASAKILPKPISGATHHHGNAGSTVVVVTTVPSSHVMPSRTVTAGSKMVSVTPSGSTRIIGPTRTGVIPPKHVQITTLKSSAQQPTVLSGSGGTRYSASPMSGKPNVIVVQKGAGGSGVVSTRKLVTSLHQQQQPQHPATPQQQVLTSQQLHHSSPQQIVVTSQQIITPQQQQTLMSPRTPPSGQVTQSGFEKDFVSFIEKQGTGTSTTVAQKIERRLAPRIEGQATQKITVVRQKADGTSTSQPMIITSGGAKHSQQPMIITGGGGGGNSGGPASKQSILAELIGSKNISQQSVFDQSESEDARAAAALQMQTAKDGVFVDNEWVEIDSPSSQSQSMSQSPGSDVIKALLDLKQAGKVTVTKTSGGSKGQELVTLDDSGEMRAGSEEDVQYISTDQGTVRVDTSQAGIMSDPRQRVQIDIINNEQEQMAGPNSAADIIGELDPNTGILYTTQMLGGQQIIGEGEISSITPIRSMSHPIVTSQVDPTRAHTNLIRHRQMAASRPTVVHHPEGRIAGRKVLERQVITTGGIVQRHVIDDVTERRDDVMIVTSSAATAPPTTQPDFITDALSQAKIDLHQMMEEDEPSPANQNPVIQISAANQSAGNIRLQPRQQQQPTIVGLRQQAVPKQVIRQVVTPKQLGSGAVGGSLVSILSTAKPEAKPHVVKVTEQHIMRQASNTSQQESQIHQYTSQTAPQYNPEQQPIKSSDQSEDSSQNEAANEIKLEDGSIISREELLNIAKAQGIEIREEGEDSESGLSQEAVESDVKLDPEFPEASSEPVAEIYQESGAIAEPPQQQLTPQVDTTPQTVTTPQMVTTPQTVTTPAEEIRYVDTSEFKPEQQDTSGHLITEEVIRVQSANEEQIDAGERVVEEGQFQVDLIPASVQAETGESVGTLDALGMRSVMTDDSEYLTSEPEDPAAYASTSLSGSWGDEGTAKRKRKPPARADDEIAGSQLPVWARHALVLLQKVSRYRGMYKQKGDHPAALWFIQPVDRNEVPDYYNIIKHPMDFSTIRRKFECNEYGSIEEFNADMLLVRDNCFTYNPVGSLVRQDCDEVFAYYTSEYDKLAFKLQQSHLGSPSSKKARLDRSPIR